MLGDVKSRRRQPLHDSIQLQKHNSKSNKETTKILLLIASCFLLLNFPIAVTKTYYFLIDADANISISS